MQAKHSRSNFDWFGDILGNASQVNEFTQLSPYDVNAHDAKCVSGITVFVEA